MKFLPSREILTKGWQRTLFIMFFAQMITAVGFSSIFPFLPLYVKALGSTTGLSIELLAGLVFSAQGFTMMIASPIWGMLADKYGRKLMVERSMFGGAVILLLMAFARSAEELVLLRTIQGFITGTMAASAALVASVVPRDRTGYAMGVLQVGIGSGVALGPMIGGFVADAYGYGAAFYVTSSLLLIAGITVLVGVQETFVPDEDLEGKGGPFIGRWRQIFSIPGVLMTYGMRFMSQLGRMMIFPLLPFFIQTILPDDAGANTFSGLVIGVGAASTTLSSVFLGRLGDRVGHRTILIACTFLAGCLYLPQSFATEGWHLLVFYAFVGVAMGGVFPSISALLARYTLHGEEGAVYGLDNSIQSGARAMAPMLGSGVVLWFGLRSMFMATALLFLIAGLLAVWKLPQVKSQDTRSYEE